MSPNQALKGINGRLSVSWLEIMADAEKHTAFAMVRGPPIGMQPGLPSEALPYSRNQRDRPPLTVADGVDRSVIDAVFGPSAAPCSPEIFFSTIKYTNLSFSH